MNVYLQPMILKTKVNFCRSYCEAIYHKINNNKR